MIAPTMLGRMWRVIIAPVRVPVASAAVMKSRARRLSTAPRTTRAVGIHEVSPMARTTSANSPGTSPRVALSRSRKSITPTITSGSTGSDRNMSVNRMSQPSSLRR